MVLGSSPVAVSYSYLIDDGSENKKAKGTKKYVIKQKLKVNDYKNCLLNNEIVLKLQKRFASVAHNVYVEEINKIALTSNDDKRLQTCDTITLYPYGTSAAKVFETELLEHLNVKWLILMIKRIKTKLNLIQNDHIFQISHTEN